MARRPPPAILSESDLALCLSRIPWQLVEQVKGRARLFVVERLKDPRASDAEILRRSGYSPTGSANKIPRRPDVQAALAAAFAAAVDEARIDAAYLFRKVKVAIEGAEEAKEYTPMTSALALAGKWVRLGERDEGREDADAQARRLRAQLDAMDEATAA